MGSHKAVLEEHSRLDILVRDLKKVCQWDTALLVDKQVRERLSGDLQLLRLRLREHFDTEESGSYMEEIRNRKPSAVDKLQALQAEHPLFLEKISFLEAASLLEDDGTGTYDVLLEKLSEILDLLKRHEDKENALINEVFRS